MPIHPRRRVEPFDRTVFQVTKSGLVYHRSSETRTVAFSKLVDRQLLLGIVAVIRRDGSSIELGVQNGKAIQSMLLGAGHIV